jgi:hypothetical protein
MKVGVVDLRSRVNVSQSLAPAVPEHSGTLQMLMERNEHQCPSTLGLHQNADVKKPLDLLRRKRGLVQPRCTAIAIPTQEARAYQF